jgi:predicted  nucleic acid-binding Zn-ribbon protein
MYDFKSVKILKRKNFKMNLIEQVKLEEQAEALFNEGKYIIVQNLCEIILKNKPTNTKANELLAYILANE